uniref:Uncharacterized protein n=1 Tax=Anguilla anguilla TaxID=7936 RepID=A0A0E9XF44_ANGAN
MILIEIVEDFNVVIQYGFINLLSKHPAHLTLHFLNDLTQ